MIIRKKIETAVDVLCRAGVSEGSGMERYSITLTVKSVDGTFEVVLGQQDMDAIEKMDRVRRRTFKNPE